MKLELSTVFLFFFGACFALTTSKATFISLHKRSPTPLRKEIDRPNKFYRAVTGKEVAHIDNYPLNGHPRSFLNTPGDFSSTGGLYVFHVCTSKYVCCRTSLSSSKNYICLGPQASWTLGRESSESCSKRREKMVHGRDAIWTGTWSVYSEVRFTGDFWWNNRLI